LVRIAAGEVGEPDQLQRSQRPLHALGARHRPGLERQRDVLGRDPPRQQPVVLEHVADAVPAHRLAGVPAEHADAARVGQDQACRKVEERALAGAGLAQDGDNAAARDRETHLAEHLQKLAAGRREHLGDVLEGDHRVRLIRALRRRVGCTSGLAVGEGGQGHGGATG
jgi:hypothetical protein